jgi:glycosyltransferase involved in cell wall biosynthesis
MTQSLRVAVITPYYNEHIDTLRRCHESVLNQTYDCLHVLVADGRANTEIDRWPSHHIVLPVSHNDIGSTPRLIGSYHAIGLGVDAVAFLDADNWYSPNHINGLMQARQHNSAAFASSGRMLWSLDGHRMGECPLIDPLRFIDTNCMLFGREAFGLLHQWVLMPSYGHLIGDRIIYHHVQNSGLTRVHVPHPTVNYLCGKEGLYKLMNQPVPATCSKRPDYESSFKKWIQDGNPPLT